MVLFSRQMPSWIGLAIGVTLAIQNAAASTSEPSGNISLRDIAGISVIDTPLVQAAEEYALRYSNQAVYKHLMRSWLYGVLLIDSDETLGSDVDLEVHAVSALLHDLGLDSTGGSPLISTDKRFEVDAAIAARDFIKGHEKGSEWESRRVQLVWDAIALHTERSIAYYKELEVQVLSKGIQMDFLGPMPGIPEEKYAAVGEEFPKDDLKQQFNQSFIWLCGTKPATTYDTWMQPWGENYVEDYEPVGKRRFDLIFGNLTTDV
ncbi:hypothetical protein N3K66_000244 [Trichothecium roseum]|uniref:Uncharacterized protein n=1 Tax=Trichothecium roseum TaxID=47278 RepID=A0ACC0VBB9_9HYPO|nr:hypothetical protein N3K66_000244 [Trichothecium roseum]